MWEFFLVHVRRQTLNVECVDGLDNFFVPLVGGNSQIESAFRVSWTFATLSATRAKRHTGCGCGIEKRTSQDGMRFTVGEVLIQKFLQLVVLFEEECLVK